MLHVGAPALQATFAEALQFALRHAAPAASAKRLQIGCDAEPGLTAACDRQTCRQILTRLVEAAIVGSAAGGEVSIIGRRVKGVVLLARRVPRRRRRGGRGAASAARSPNWSTRPAGR